MLGNKDVVNELNELVKIERLKVIGKVGMAIWVSHQKFTFKGTVTDDIAVQSGSFLRTEDGWKLLYGSRSTGRKPEEPPPTF